MNNIKFDLINNKNERDIIMNEERLDVLDKVKELVMLKGEYMTTKMVADYYERPESTINSVIGRHREELIKNGMKKFTNKELKSLNIQDEYFKIPNAGMILFNKRSILNVGMLLTESPIAEEVRTLLLDNHEQLNNIHKKLDNGEEITEEDIDKSDPLYFEKKEEELRQQELEIVKRLAEFIINGDMTSCISISRELNKMQEDLIA